MKTESEAKNAANINANTIIKPQHQIIAITQLGHLFKNGLCAIQPLMMITRSIISITVKTKQNIENVDISFYLYDNIIPENRSRLVFESLRCTE